MIYKVCGEYCIGQSLPLVFSTIFHFIPDKTPRRYIAGSLSEVLNICPSINLLHTMNDVPEVSSLIILLYL